MDEKLEKLIVTVLMYVLMGIFIIMAIIVIYCGIKHVYEECFKPCFNKSRQHQETQVYRNQPYPTNTSQIIYVKPANRATTAAVRVSSSKTDTNKNKTPSAPPITFNLNQPPSYQTVLNEKRQNFA